MQPVTIDTVFIMIEMLALTLWLFGIGFIIISVISTVLVKSAPSKLNERLFNLLILAAIYSSTIGGTCIIVLLIISLYKVFLNRALLHGI